MTNLASFNPFRRRNVETSTSLAPFYPRQLMQDFEDFFDRDFDSMMGLGSWPTRLNGPADLSCACDLQETDKHFLLTMDMPGVAKEAIDIDVSGSRLIVRAERRSEISRGDKAQSWFEERRYGKIQRSFTLPDTADTSHIEADFSNGVLQVLIPKTETTKTEKIKVKSSSGGFFDRVFGSKKEASAPVNIKEEKRA